MLLYIYIHIQHIFMETSRFQINPFSLKRMLLSPRISPEVFRRARYSTDSWSNEEIMVISSGCFFDHDLEEFDINLHLYISIYMYIYIHMIDDMI